nr:uncharacterized protein LOC104119869 [Nicotiana tomentosiformis]
MDLKLNKQVISRRGSLKCLGSIIQGDGEIDEDITHRIGAGRMKWRLASSVLCNKNMPLKLKECWPVKNSHIQKIKVAKMKMLRWICGHNRLDRIRNKVSWDKVDVAPVEDKMAEVRLRWFRHVKKKSAEALVRRCERLALMGIVYP